MLTAPSTDHCSGNRLFMFSYSLEKNKLIKSNHLIGTNPSTCNGFRWIEHSALFVFILDVLFFLFTHVASCGTNWGFWIIQQSLMFYWFSACDAFIYVFQSHEPRIRAVKSQRSRVGVLLRHQITGYNFVCFWLWCHLLLTTAIQAITDTHTHTHTGNLAFC